jgi:uncharacterized delta-60 repeat protein
MTENMHGRTISKLGNINLIRWRSVVFFALLCPLLAVRPNSADLDQTFSPPTISGGPGGVRDIVVQPDGKIIIVGFFQELDELDNTQGMVRLNPDGSIDYSFTPEVSGSPRCVALQPDGKILVGGNTFGGPDFFAYCLIRFNPDGSLDRSFDAGDVVASTVEDIVLQKDGKIIAVGNIPRGIVRLNSDGAPDLTFDPGSGFSGPVSAVAMQEDGKVIVTGSFLSVNNLERMAIARLLSNGSVDSGFVVEGWKYGSWVHDVAVQKDGKIVIGGSFSRYPTGASNDYIARLNWDGSVDASFNVNASSYVYCVKIDQYGRILVGGWFTAINGTARNYVARILSSGVLDNEFNSYTGPSTNVFAIAEQLDGKILVGGDFQSIYGETFRYIARLQGGPDLVLPTDPSLSSVIKNGELYQLSHQSDTGLVYSMQRSSDLVYWEFIGEQTAGTGNPLVWTVNMSVPLQFWRLVATESVLPQTPPQQDLNILEAQYGANETYNDVSSIIESNVINGSVSMQINNSAMGGDPVFGSVKELFIRYNYGGTEFTLTVQEGQMLNIP